jgi:hypothetical protein
MGEFLGILNDQVKINATQQIRRLQQDLSNFYGSEYDGNTHTK